MENQQGGNFLMNVRNLSVPFGLLLAHKGLQKLIQSNETVKPTKSRKTVAKKLTAAPKKKTLVAKKLTAAPKKAVKVTTGKKTTTDSKKPVVKKPVVKKDKKVSTTGKKTRKVTGGYFGDNLSGLNQVFTGLNAALGRL